jgi:hypothetical protein
MRVNSGPDRRSGGRIPSRFHHPEGDEELREPESSLAVRFSGSHGCRRQFGGWSTDFGNEIRVDRVTIAVHVNQMFCWIR